MESVEWFHTTTVTMKQILTELQKIAAFHKIKIFSFVVNTNPMGFEVSTHDLTLQFSLF